MQFRHFFKPKWAVLICTAFLLLSVGTSYAKYQTTTNPLTINLTANPASRADLPDSGDVVVGGSTEFTNNFGYFKLIKATATDVEFYASGYSGKYEKIAIPLTNLEPGNNYRLTFLCTGETRLESIYNFGFLVTDKATRDRYLAISSSGGDYTEVPLPELHWRYTGTEQKFSGIEVSVVFNSTAETMYWVWDMCDIDNYIAADGGPIYTYKFNDISIIPTTDSVTATIQTSAAALSLDPEEEASGVVALDISALENLSITYPSMDELAANGGWPVDSDIYLGFTAAENYTLPETLTVRIGETEYTVQTSGESSTGHICFDPDYMELFISRELFPTDGTPIEVIAQAAAQPQKTEPAPTETVEPSDEETQ